MVLQIIINVMGLQRLELEFQDVKAARAETVRALREEFKDLPPHTWGLFSP